MAVSLAACEISSVKEWRDLQNGLVVVQGHWKWRRSINHIRLSMVGHCKYSSILYCFRVIWRWVISWPWNLGQRSLRVTELRCGFIFAFYSYYGTILYRLRIFGKVGRLASEEVVVQLLLHKINVCQFCYMLWRCVHQTRDLYSHWTSLLTVSSWNCLERQVLYTVRDCQWLFGVALPRIVLAKRFDKFIARYGNTPIKANCVL